jgi:hypothetical protein
MVEVIVEHAPPPPEVTLVKFPWRSDMSAAFPVEVSALVSSKMRADVSAFPFASETPSGTM